MSCFIEYFRNYNAENAIANRVLYELSESDFDVEAIRVE